EGITGLDTSFGRTHSGAARLGDARRTRRLVRVADAFVRHPGGTFPEKLPDPHQLDAFYNLMAAEDVTHRAVLEPHIQHTLAAAPRPPHQPPPPPRAPRPGGRLDPPQPA